MDKLLKLNVQAEKARAEKNKFVREYEALPKRKQRSSNHLEKAASCRDKEVKALEKMEKILQKKLRDVVSRMPGNQGSYIQILYTLRKRNS